MEANVVWHHATVNRQRRESQNSHRAIVLWFTGLSGAGKSTLAHAVEEELHQLNRRTYVLDGDNIRHGINKGLGFSKEDRAENLRRVTEIAKLFVDAGIIVLAAFISPLAKDRAAVRAAFATDDFFEIYCSASIEKCEERDVKGLYVKARQGAIAEFTGVSAPYEVPEHADLQVDTGTMSLEEAVATVMRFVKTKIDTI